MKGKLIRMPHKILLIDDSKTQLEALKLQFLKAGFEIETAQDGSEGYKKVFETAPDLILSDIIMPNLNGFQLCRLLKNNEATKEIPIILLTVLDKKIDKFWGNKSGADKFISKTATHQEIEESVKKLIGINPVSQEYKTQLGNNIISDETVQNQINIVLDDLLMNSTFLNEFRDLGEFLSHERALIEKTFELLNSFVDYNIAGLFLNNPDKNEKNILYFDLNKSSVSGFVIEKVKREFFSNMPDISSFSVRDFGHEIIKETVENDQLILNSEEFKTKHILPLVFNNKLLGGICFYNKDECNYSEFKFYKTMVSELGILLRMRYLYSESEYLSVTDGLTGLYNRRHFEINIEREFLRVRRYKAELSLAMIDIDHFKNINDTYGHQFGDFVLREISDIIVESFRKTDMIYRYGGEEIAVVLTETSLENATIPLERLREKISQHDFVYNGQKIRATISIGVSQFTTETKNQQELIKCSDSALYKAKQDGRNKLVAFVHEQSHNII